MADDSKVEIVVENREGKQNEYLVESADPRHEVVQRRRAYDAHLKTDILYSGREQSMNATFDPFYYNNFGYWGAHGHNYAYGWRPRAVGRNSELQKSPNSQMNETRDSNALPMN